MVKILETFCTFVGASVICGAVAIGLAALVTWIRRNSHRHSYQISIISSMHHKERDCDSVQICLRCEKCGKRRNFSFWNDRIKIQAVPEQFDEKHLDEI